MSELRTDVLKDGAGTGSPSFPNGLAQADIANAVNAAGSAPIFGCRAWVNFDGTRNVDDTGASINGQPVLIRGSGNVTSVVKNSTGDYTINFTTAMPDTNFGTTISVSSDASSAMIFYEDGSHTTARTTSSQKISIRSNIPTAVDRTSVSVMIFR